MAGLSQTVFDEWLVSVLVREHAESVSVAKQHKSNNSLPVAPCVSMHLLSD